MSLGSFDVDLEVDNAMKALEITNPEFVNFEIRFDGSTAASGSKDGSLGRESSLGRDSLGKDSLGPAWSTRGDPGAGAFSSPPTTARKKAYPSWGRKSPQATLETSSLTYTNANNTASASGSGPPPRQGLPRQQQAYVAPVISVEQKSDSSSLTDANEYTSNVFREQERGGYRRMQQPQWNRGGGKNEEGNGSIPENGAVAAGPQHAQDEEEASSPSIKDRISRFGTPPPAKTPRAVSGTGRQWQQPQQQPAAAPPWAKSRPNSAPKPSPQRDQAPSGGSGDGGGGDNGNPFQVILRKTGVKPASTETERDEPEEAAAAAPPAEEAAAEEPPRKLTWREQQELKRRQREADGAAREEDSGTKKDVAALIRERVAAARRDPGAAGAGGTGDVGATSAVVDWRGNLKRRSGDVVVPAPAAASVGRGQASPSVSPTRATYKPRSHRHPSEGGGGGRGDSGDKVGGDGAWDDDDGGPAEDPRAALMAMLGRRSAPSTPSGAPAEEAPRPPAPVNPVAAMIQQRAAASATPPKSDPAPNPAAALGAMFAKRSGHAAAAPSPGPPDTAKDDARGALNAMLAGRTGGPGEGDGRPALKHDPK